MIHTASNDLAVHIMNGTGWYSGTQWSDLWWINCKNLWKGLWCITLVPCRPMAASKCLQQRSVTLWASDLYASIITTPIWTRPAKTWRDFQQWLISFANDYCLSRLVIIISANWSPAIGLQWSASCWDSSLSGSLCLSHSSRRDCVLMKATLVASTEISFWHDLWVGGSHCCRGMNSFRSLLGILYHDPFTKNGEWYADLNILHWSDFRS